MRKIELLPGERFGKLVIIEELRREKDETGKFPQRQFLCRCDCGNTKIATPYKLLNGELKSCGCGRSKSLEGAWKRQPNVAPCPYPTKSCRDSKVGRCCYECPSIVDCPHACNNHPDLCGRNKISRMVTNNETS